MLLDAVLMRDVLTPLIWEQRAELCSRTVWVVAEGPVDGLSPSLFASLITVLTLVNIH